MLYQPSLLRHPSQLLTLQFVDEALGADEGRDDALRRVRYQLGRCEDAIDLAHMTLIRVGRVEPEWSQECRLDLEVLRSKIGNLASLLGPAQERLGELVDRMEREAGPVPPEAYERLLRQWHTRE